MGSEVGAEAVELAESAGLLLDPWQAWTLEQSMAERASGKWAATEVGLVVPRQDGKGAILEARELAGLFLLGEQLQLHSAHEFKTAQEAFRRILFLIQNDSDLERRVKTVRTSHGEEGIELLDGCRLRFVARSTGSGRGFSGDTIYLDEAFNLSAAAVAALFPTMSARPNPQVWYTSSAPLAEQMSAVLRQLGQRGRAGGSPRLAYFEWCADYTVDERGEVGPPDLNDPQAWADANPGLGYRIDAEFIELERDALGPDEFARERLGIWYPDSDDADSIDADDWDACLDQGLTLQPPFAMAFDVTRDRRQGAIAFSGLVNGWRYVELVYHDRAGRGMREELARLVDRWKPTMVTCDPAGAAGGLLKDLEESGIDIHPVTLRELVQACGGLFDDVAEHDLRHNGEPKLKAAVLGAVKRGVGDAWLWDRKHSTADISPLVAVTLARWASIEAPEPTVSEGNLSVW